MSEFRLKNDVLARADGDDSLSEHTRLVVRAALESPEDLAEALGGEGVAADPKKLPHAPQPPASPVGASIPKRKSRSG
jgi:hypothetical protein